MKIVLHELLKRNDGKIQLKLSVGAERVQTFFATYDNTDSTYKFCSVDDALFMRLSDLADEQFGNRAVYQMELMGIIGEFAKREGNFVLPATLGTTKFCTLKPGRMRSLWNRLFGRSTSTKSFH